MFDLSARIPRRGWLVAVLLASAAGGLAWGQGANLLNPTSLPPLLQHPLQLFATTDPAHKGADYRPLKPGQKVTIATVKGPAVIFRIWSTSSLNEKVKLEMTLDGKTELLYAKDALPPNVKAGVLRGLDGKAYWSYIPLAVKQKAVFTAQSLGGKEDIRLFLQVGYRHVTKGELKQITSTAVTDLRQAVQAAMNDPLYGAKGLQTSTGNLKPGTPWEMTWDKPVLVRALVIDAGAQATLKQIQHTRLSIIVDNNRCLDVPLGALCAEYWGLRDYTSLATAVSGHKFILRFPLPVGKKIDVVTDVFGGDPVPAATVTLYSKPLHRVPKYLLCAQYFAGVSVAKQPLRLLRVNGAGVFVGSNLAVDGLEHKTFAFLEGNEQIYLNNAPTPTLEGTGTEDYFNCAWYFASGPVSHAFHGVTFKQDQAPPRVSAYRYMISDCIPFTTGLRFDLQHGMNNSSPDTLYRAVMFWYQQPPVNVLPPAAAVLKPGQTGATQPQPSQGVLPSGPWVLVVIVILLIVAWVVLDRVRKGRKRAREEGRK